MTTVHLVRHGEVSNPNHVVYADLDGFNLSPLGVLQAQQAAATLAHRRIDAVFTSPLARARQTATAIARPHELAPTVQDDLTETRQYPGWTGRRWDELDVLFPGQVERYLDDASTLTDVEESLAGVVARVVGVIEAGRAAGFGEIVVVSHQDPTQAARLAMTGGSLSDLRTDPPPHCAVITLSRSQSGDWTESSMWAPGPDDVATHRRRWPPRSSGG
ncbi:MAG: histidine phosphatase family protein [Acidimicrobiia bacterium]|nr:histidine phosphatase family protein [Acidimicrobiia bacterium]